MYLGDGYIYRMPHTYVLRIYLHKDQRQIVDRVRRAIAALLPEHRVGEVAHGPSCVVLQCYFSGLAALFPQHGPGRKHRRPIVLEPWQREILEREPFEFLKGCIESDGSRHRRVVAGRNYPAYTFTNRSEDILQLFMEACRLVGLRPRRSNFKNISIARRTDVARLDALFGVTDGTGAGPAEPCPAHTL